MQRVMGYHTPRTIPQYSIHPLIYSVYSFKGLFRWSYLKPHFTHTLCSEARGAELPVRWLSTAVWSTGKALQRPLGLQVRDLVYIPNYEEHQNWQRSKSCRTQLSSRSLNLFSLWCSYSSLFWPTIQFPDLQPLHAVSVTVRLSLRSKFLGEPWFDLGEFRREVGFVIKSNTATKKEGRPDVY